MDAEQKHSRADLPDDFDKTVGRIAGAICGDLIQRFQKPPLLLIPPITFKVRKVLESLADVKLMSPRQREAVARDIRVAAVPMLFSLDINAEMISEMGPMIEDAAYRAMGLGLDEGASADDSRS